MSLKLWSVRNGRAGLSSGPRLLVAQKEEWGMLRLRCAIATLLVVSCAACSEDKAAPEPRQSAPTSKPTASETSTPPELVGYTEAERSAYSSAVSEYDRFTRRSDSFYAAGETTLRAKRFYQEYAADWSTAWGNLARVANSGVKVRGKTAAVWTKPRSITLGSADGDVVVLRRCLDESGRVVTQNGRELAQPQLEDPHVYTVRLEKRTGEDRWRSGVAQQGATC